MTKLDTVIAPNPAVDLAIVEEMVGELEDYIVKDEVYRTIRARTPDGIQAVQMSGGDLLARLHRLNAEAPALAAALRQRTEAISAQATTVIYSLRTRFHLRLEREIRARIGSLKWFLDDAAGDPRRLRQEYPYEIRNRQRIAVMLDELGADASPDILAAVAQMDQRLRLAPKPAGFLWDDKLAPLYPAEKFWFLYGG